MAFSEIQMKASYHIQDIMSGVIHRQNSTYAQSARHWALHSFSLSVQCKVLLTMGLTFECIITSILRGGILPFSHSCFWPLLALLLPLLSVIGAATLNVVPAAGAAGRGILQIPTIVLLRHHHRPVAAPASEPQRLHVGVHAMSRCQPCWLQLGL